MQWSSHNLTSDQQMRWYRRFGVLKLQRKRKQGWFLGNVGNIVKTDFVTSDLHEHVVLDWTGRRKMIHIVTANSLRLSLSWVEFNFCQLRTMSKLTFIIPLGSMFLVLDNDQLDLVFELRWSQDLQFRYVASIDLLPSYVECLGFMF